MATKRYDHRVFYDTDQKAGHVMIESAKSAESLMDPAELAAIQAAVEDIVGHEINVVKIREHRVHLG